MSYGDSPESSNPYQSPHEQPRAADGITPSVRTADMLRQTRPWVRFLGILGFVSIGFMLLAAAGMLLAALASRATGAGGGIPLVQAIVFGVMYVVMGLLYIIPSMYLLRYASRISTFLDEGSVVTLDAALEAQKSFWKFVGILMAIILGIYGLVLVFAVIFGMVGWVVSR